ncbi:hypothetical protein MAR_017893 [Mya arenaria]|uniref:Uncharacterized protein n=1 Tax=Mya arenaria TaxID=6604 RepID=A0ABY7EDI8_MYAAR|nr:hypothetical protein MAR_017893 [Mya arenaria]
MAVDVYRTFSNSSQISATRRSRRAMLLYSMYGWMLPAVLLVLALVFEYGLSSKKISNWKPSYGTKGLFIGSQ